MAQAGCLPLWEFVWLNTVWQFHYWHPHNNQREPRAHPTSPGDTPGPAVLHMIAPWPRWEELGSTLWGTQSTRESSCPQNSSTTAPTWTARKGCWPDRGGESGNPLETNHHPSTWSKEEWAQLWFIFGTTDPVLLYGEHAVCVVGKARANNV